MKQNRQRTERIPMRNRSIQMMAVFLSILVLLASLAVACGAGNSATSPNNTISATTAAGYPGSKGGAASDGALGYGGNATLPTSGQPINMATKIIRNANLDVEADDVLKAYESLLKFAAEKGGYEANRKVSTNGDFSVLEATIKIAPEHLDAFLNFAGTTGKVINVQTTSQDITESYYDAKTRLETMESLLKKYSEFLTNAKTVNEALSVQAEINRLTTEIEALKGKLRYYDGMISESTVTILIRQVNDPIKIQKKITWSALTFNDMGYLMQYGLLTIVNALTSVVQWLAIALVALSPIVVICLIILLLIRRRRKSHKNQPQTPPTDTVNRDNQG